MHDRAYLAWAPGQAERHAYLPGEVYAMTGACDPHNTNALNIAVQLHAALRAGPCRFYIADTGQRLAAADTVFYPDLMVSCDPHARNAVADTCKRQPKRPVEVLSESTAAFDRGREFDPYRTFGTLEVLLGQPRRRHADIVRREAGGRWVLESRSPAGEVRSASLGVNLPLDGVYEDVRAASA